MQRGSRTANSIKSAATAVAGQAFNVLLKFVTRTVFINTIGAEYLGVNGLFTSVLTILNISELGLSTAIVFSLYKPLAQENQKVISATMNFLRRAYLIIGATVLVLGLALYPFLPYLMKGTTDLVNVNLVYALYVLNSAFSYWFYAYKTAILQADQKRYIINIVNNIVAAITATVQVVALFFGSFVGYVMVQLLGNVVQGLVNAIVVNIFYPYLKEYKKEKLPKEEKTKIIKNVFATSLYKISSAVLNATDNLIISAKISTFVVGMHSNYVLILSAVTQLVQNIFSAFTASIGNLFAVEKKEKSEFVFRCLNFMNFWIYGFCAICLWNLFNPFIELMWGGKEMVFDDFTVLCIVMNFLTAGLQNAVISYKDACGLFWQGRYRPAASAIFNIIISLLLVKPLGVAGVFLGTIISRFMTTWWFDARLVHRHAFGISPKKYYVRYFLSLIRVSAVGAAISFSTLPLQKYGAIMLFAVRFALCMIVPNVYFLLRFRKTEEFKYLTDKLQPILKKLKR